MKKVSDTSPRITETRALMRAHNVDALLLTNLEDRRGENIRYLSGFTGSSSVCLLTQDAKILMTDPRYGLQAEQESAGWDIRVRKTYPVSDLIKRHAPRRLGFIGEEVSWARVNRLRAALSKIEFVDLPDIVKEVRAVKDEGEISAIRAAVRMMEEVLVELCDEIEVGVTTDCALAKALKIKLIQRGSDVSFAPIILGGSDSAFIHGDPFKLSKERGRKGVVPAEKVIQRGDIIQFDVGCLVDGYVSDISRVAVVGKATDEQKRMHRAVCEAIDAAAVYYKLGLLAKKAMREASRVLKMHGFQEGMMHGLGHGIGLEVHELPTTSVSKNFVFRAGNVVSLEPGVYRRGWGGMRIEHDVLITEKGPEFLDLLTTDLIEI